MGNAASKDDSITLSNSYQSISQNQLENNLSLSLGTLDTNLNNSKVARNATEGSAFNISWQANIGDKISFEYSFNTYDYAPFADFAFYTINSKAYSLVALGESGINTGKTQGSFSHTISEADLANDKEKVFNLSVGVVDVLDTYVDTSINITELSLVNTNLTSEYILEPGTVDSITGELTENKEIDNKKVSTQESEYFLNSEYLEPLAKINESQAMSLLLQPESKTDLAYEIENLSIIKEIIQYELI